MPSNIVRANSSNIRKSTKVEIDGKVWTLKLPSAAQELEITRVQRNIATLQKKLDSDNYTEEDVERLNNYDQFIFDRFKAMFRDSTEDNTEVEAWFDNEPLYVIIATIEDIKRQALGD